MSVDFRDKLVAEQMITIATDEISYKKMESLYGNYILKITKKQLDDLQNGKTLCCPDDEYSVFVVLEKS